MSTALTHLAPARGRPNLTIWAVTTVDRVELRGTSARGIRTAGGEIVEADAVVVTAGSYASPALLMRSGYSQGAHHRHCVAGPGRHDRRVPHPIGRLVFGPAQLG